MGARALRVWRESTRSTLAPAPASTAGAVNIRPPSAPHQTCVRRALPIPTRLKRATSKPTALAMRATRGAMGARALHVWRESTRATRAPTAAATAGAVNIRRRGCYGSGLVRCVHLPRSHQRKLSSSDCICQAGYYKYRAHARDALRESSSRRRAMRRAVTVEWEIFKECGSDIRSHASVRGRKICATTGQGEGLPRMCCRQVLKCRSTLGYCLSGLSLGQTSSAGSDSQMTARTMRSRLDRIPRLLHAVSIGKYKSDVGVGSCLSVLPTHTALSQDSRLHCKPASRKTVAHAQVQSWDIQGGARRRRCTAVMQERTHRQALQHPLHVSVRSWQILSRCHCMR